MKVTWIGGPQDGGEFVVPGQTEWVTFSETIRPTPAPGAAVTPESVQWRAPVRDGKALWLQRERVTA